MCRQGRLFLYICFALPMAALLPSWGAAQTTSTPLEMMHDAELTAVYFLDATHGWAVGERGAVLRTTDGGRNWQLQRTPTSCRLETVHFVNPREGWAAGGAAHPYTHRSSGVVLRTRDGGVTWSAIANLTLPHVKQIHFVNAQQGWAVGTPSSMYPTGVFRTQDGGRSWTTLPAGVAGSWLAGAFTNSEHGVVVGRDGRLAVVRGPQVQSCRTPSLGLRAIRSVDWEDDQHGWLVGDGGLVLHTRDAGVSWQVSPGGLPPGAIDLFDFHALSVVGPAIWVAGSPGSCIFHSPDRGASWQVFRTEQNLPIRDLVFVDSQRGWAVGALGVILATRDGGASWQRQKPGVERLALLGLFADSDKLPLELFAQESGEEGYIGFAEILGRRDVELPDLAKSNAADRAAGAMVAVGASGAEQAWNFPLRQPGIGVDSDRVIEQWNRANDGRGLEELEELVVRKIRQWRPEVVVTEPAGPDGGNPVAHIINQIVLSAARRAADGTRFPDHATLAGLEPWQVTKVFSVNPEDERAATTISTTTLSARLGCSIADRARNGYMLINSEYRRIPLQVGFRLLFNELPQSSGRQGIFGGIYLQAGGKARRQLGPPAVQDIEALTRAAQKRRNIEQLLEQTPSSAAAAGGWLGQVEDMTRGLQDEQAGQLLYQLGQQYWQHGRSTFAAQAFEQLVHTYPRHALAEAAQLWLIQYHSSSEIAWQLKQTTGFRQQQAVATPRQMAAVDPLQPGAVQQAYLESQIDQGAVAQASFQHPGFQYQGIRSTAAAADQLGQGAAAALDIAKSVQLGAPELFAEPLVQFPVSVAYRARGMSRESERFYHRLAAVPSVGGWKECAQAELWLAHGRGRPPKPTVNCHAAADRPRLDGRLDEAVWKDAQRIELTSSLHDDNQWPAAIMLACDREFLYLAVSCRQAPDCDYPTATGPRPRDPDLSDQDRVDLFLDLDRDYVSSYRLTVDHRGWTGEACWGNQHWDPTWYVAASSTEQNWTVEAAIPFKELAPETPQPRDVWAVAVRRIVPGVGLQAQAEPVATTPRPGSFSLVVFP
jgi:photosystem II stability/assembly factor-like uncharacterized protein